MIPAKQLVLLLFYLPSIVFAGNPNTYWLQLHNLNESSRQALQRSQQRPMPGQQDPRSAQEQARDDLTDREQGMAQKYLQERQRRHMLILNQRQRVTPPGMNERLKFNLQQQRNLQEQHYQLNRFRLQNQMRRP